MPDYVIRWDLKIEADTPDAAAILEVVRILLALYATLHILIVLPMASATMPRCRQAACQLTKTWSSQPYASAWHAKT